MIDLVGQVAARDVLLLELLKLLSCFKLFQKFHLLPHLGRAILIVNFIAGHLFFKLS